MSKKPLKKRATFESAFNDDNMKRNIKINLPDRLIYDLKELMKRNKRFKNKQEYYDNKNKK